ncbi:MAG: hypothetical protein ACXWQ5_05830 [Ktedonobacterales bacterium]
MARRRRAARAVRRLAVSPVGVSQRARESERKAQAGLGMRRLLAIAALVELFLLGLLAVAPVGGVSQSISPLARAWPWLLAPARVIFGDALVDGSVPAERGWPALALFAALLVGASCAAALALPLCRRGVVAGRGYLALALGCAAALGATLVLLPSLPSDDVFSYILYGRIGVVHHANPLVTAPSAFPHDPFLALVFWQGVLSVYGPVWLLLSGGITLFAEGLGGSLATYVLLFKLLGLVAHLANAALIWAILGRLAPQRRLLGTLLYAWNPLCLLEFCASAHNDAVMLTFALLGVYCLARAEEAPARGPSPVRGRGERGAREMADGESGGRLKPRLGAPLRFATKSAYADWERAREWLIGQHADVLWELGAVVCFGLSIATKYVLLALLPLYLALVWWRGRELGEEWRRVTLALVWRVGVVVAVVVVTALPFWAGPRTLGAILYSPPAQQLDNSLLEAVSWPLRALAQVVGGPRVVVENGLKVLGLAGFGVVWLAQFRRARTLEGMIAAWGWALLGYVVIASGWFWPWYVTWVVAFAALAPWGTLTVAALLLAGGVLTLYAFLPLYAAPVYGFRALLAFGPALGYLGWRWWQERRKGDDVNAATQTD